MIIAFNKPYGVLSQFNENPDKPGQKTLADFDLPPEFHPVGRLDMDSEGLLLLSDDPGYERELLRPAKAHKRTYLVQVDGQLDKDAIREITAGGLQIQNYETQPCRAQLLATPRQLPDRNPPVDPASDKRSSWMLITLTEGKNRQVRRMTAKIGYPTLRLLRVSIGEFDLESLEPGKWAFLSADEEALLEKK